MALSQPLASDAARIVIEPHLSLGHVVPPPV
jgi:hypothetical protein